MGWGTLKVLYGWGETLQKKFLSDQSFQRHDEIRGNSELSRAFCDKPIRQ